jgi:hypothetical protein
MHAPCNALDKQGRTAALALPSNTARADLLEEMQLEHQNEGPNKHCYAYAASDV